MTNQMAPIFRLHNTNLGDHWATISLCRFLGLLGARVRIGMGGMDHNVWLRIMEILELLAPGNGPDLLDDRFTAHFDGYDIWGCPVWPVREDLRWQNYGGKDTPKRHDKAFCYQFDGESAGQDKNPPKSEEAAILALMAESGWEAVKLDRSRSLLDCCKALQRCAFFIGCCSGMSHVAHSVGTPVYLYEHQVPVVTCHRLKQYVLVRNFFDFREQSQHYRAMSE